MKHFFGPPSIYIESLMLFIMTGSNQCTFIKIEYKSNTISVVFRGSEAPTRTCYLLVAACGPQGGNYSVAESLVVWQWTPHCMTKYIVWFRVKRLKKITMMIHIILLLLSVICIISSSDLKSWVSSTGSCTWYCKLSSNGLLLLFHLDIILAILLQMTLLSSIVVYN